jgi:5-methylcytosine-specific restriction endonuclease McrA
MKRLRSRRRRLDPESYRKLCRQVLERDGWQCQNCGRRTNLQVHHIHPRSLLGADAERNLITLCAECHRAAHLRLGSQR